METVSISHVYPTNGANWNDYVQFDGTTAYNAHDNPCVNTTVPRLTGCIHGGEKLKVIVSGYTSCTGLSATDTSSAFNWFCDASSGTATFYTSGLNPGKGLKDLIDSTPRWKPFGVTVQQNGAAIAQSTASNTIWGNTVLPLPGSPGPAAEILNPAVSGTIYVLTSSTTNAGYNIQKSKTGLVTLSGATLTSSNPGNTCTNAGDPGALKQCLIAASSVYDYLWIEGSFDGANATDYDIFQGANHFSVVWNSSVVRASANPNSVGVELNSSSGLLGSTTVGQNGKAGVFTSCTGCLVQNVWSNSNGGDGFHFNGSQVTGINLYAANNSGFSLYFNTSGTSAAPSVFSNIYASNNNNIGFNGPASYTIFVNVTATNNKGDGFLFNNLDHCDFHGVLSAGNNGSGFTVQGAGGKNNTFSNMVLTNNAAQGLYENAGGAPSSDFYANIVSVNNASAGVLVAGTSNQNAFTGTLMVSNNGGPKQCSVTSSGGSPGLIDANCTDAGTDGSNTYTGSPQSTATLRIGRTLASSFMGRVLSQDNTNASNLAGFETFASVTDWFNFDYVFRAWGNDGVFGTAASQSWCGTSGNCRIWDWRTSSSDTVILNDVIDGASTNPVFSDGATCPSTLDANTASNVYQDQMVPSHKYLLNAFELAGDSVANPSGNNRGICESGDGCLYMPNFGAYQGEGSYLSHTCNAVPRYGPSVTGFSIFRHPNNGG